MYHNFQQSNWARPRPDQTINRITQQTVAAASLTSATTGLSPFLYDSYLQFSVEDYCDQSIDDVFDIMGRVSINGANEDEPDGRQRTARSLYMEPSQQYHHPMTSSQGGLDSENIHRLWPSNQHGASGDPPKPPYSTLSGYPSSLSPLTIRNRFAALRNRSESTTGSDSSVSSLVGIGVATAAPQTLQPTSFDDGSYVSTSSSRILQGTSITSAPRPQVQTDILSGNSTTLVAASRISSVLNHTTLTTSLNPSGQSVRTSQVHLPSSYGQVLPPSVRDIFNRRNGNSGAFQPAHILVNNTLPAVTWTTTNNLELYKPVTSVSHGSNPNYRGHGAVGTNQDDNLDPELNCAVWIMGIHSSAGIPDLLNAVRNCGPIFSCWLNEAQPPRLPNGASKLVFTTRRGFENFMDQATSVEGIRVFGQRIHAQPNRSKYRANPNTEQTRVIRIWGPARYVNFDILNAYFSSLFFYHTCNVDEGPIDAGGYRYLIWTFGSILSQAQAAKKAIETEPALCDILTVVYLRDPCA